MKIDYSKVTQLLNEKNALDLIYGSITSAHPYFEVKLSADGAAEISIGTTRPEHHLCASYFEGLTIAQIRETMGLVSDDATSEETDMDLMDVAASIDFHKPDGMLKIIDVEEHFAESTDGLMFNIDMNMLKDKTQHARLARELADQEKSHAEAGNEFQHVFGDFYAAATEWVQRAHENLVA